LTARNGVCEPCCMRTIGRILVLASFVVAGAGGVNAQPSNNLSDYVLFAEQLMKPRGLLVPCGSIGVNSATGLLRENKGITVAGDCVANTARMDGIGSCGQLFANVTVNPTQIPTPFTPPVLTGDIATNCGFPGSFPSCDLSQPVVVDAGTTLSLPPGTYGDVIVKGGYDEFALPNPGVLQLQGGSYTFCNVKVNRFAQVRGLAPITLYVQGALKTQGNNYIGPDSGTATSDVAVYLNGTRVRYGRSSQVVAELCAPHALCGFLAGGNHLGGAWCLRVKAKNLIFACG